MDRFEERRQSEVRERAELKGFAAHHADIPRNPYLQFAVTLAPHRSGNREAAVVLAAAWWRGGTAPPDSDPVSGASPAWLNAATRGPSRWPTPLASLRAQGR